MCSTQSDEESEDDKNSLSSSFWSDGDEEKEEEEEDEIERMIDSKPATDAEDLLQGASEEVKSGLNNQSNFSKESLDKTNNDEEEEEERCSSSPDSLAPSLMTSGYGTYKPEGQEGAEYRDDHTITEFDQDSLSEMREDEEDSRSLSSFGDFIEPTHKPDFNELSVLEVSKIFDNVACCREIIHITEVHSEQKKKQAGEEECDLHAASEKKAPKEQHRTVQAEDMFRLNEKQKQEIEVHDLHGFNNVKKDVGGKAECEDPDESSSNKDIKFIDSRVNISSTMMYGNICAEWEGNLRQDRGKCFPASKSARHDTCYCKEVFFLLLFGQRLRNGLHVFGHLAIKRSALNNKLHPSLDI